MTIELRPDIEDLVRQDMQAGMYRSVEEYLEKAVLLLHSQEVWLSAHRDEIAAQIEEGWQAAKRGDSIDAEQLKDALRERKQT